MAGKEYTRKKYERPEGVELGMGMNLESSGSGYGKLEADRELTRDNFETYVGIAMSMEDILMVFDITKEEMDKWCWETYHMSFKSAYGVVLRLAQKELMGAISALAARGNPTAMQIAKEVVLGLGAEVGAETSRVVFVNDVPGGNKLSTEGEDVSDEKR